MHFLLLTLMMPSPLIEPLPLWYPQFPDYETAVKMSDQFNDRARALDNFDPRFIHAAWVWHYAARIQNPNAREDDRWYARWHLVNMIGEQNFRRGIFPQPN